MHARAFVFAGGGTGGHIYPALAIAEQLLHHDPAAHVRFLCSTRPLDAEILKGETLADRPCVFSPIPAFPPTPRPLALARFVWNWGGAVRAARATLRELASGDLARPATLIAMGGFVSAPAARAARAERSRLVLVNLDAVPGRANRWIATQTREIFSAAPVARAGWTVVPPIVRRAALAPGDRARCRERLHLDPATPTLLVTGASQGAESINAMLRALAPRLRGWQVIHQTGRVGVEPTRDAYNAAGVRALVEPFFREMGLCWGAADLGVSRAGAGSVGEAWANAVPTLFLPYPHHKDQHQAFNARPLVDAGAARLYTDHADPARNSRDAGEALLELLASPAALAGMRESFRSLGPADGAAQIAAALLQRP